MNGPCRIRVAGVGLRGPGYPNACNTLRILRDLGGVDVSDLAVWLPEETRLWKQMGSGMLASLWALAKLVVLGLLAAGRLLSDRESGRTLVYAPYPSVFMLWWLSWLPRGLRATIFCDAYVSLWDSAFNDRARTGYLRMLAGRLARRFEARALAVATRVLVDTEANERFFAESFGLPAEALVSLPLALPPVSTPARTRAPRAEGARPRLLYFGTLVPLHGLGVLAEALVRLHERGVDFHFHAIGDGQDAATLEALARRLPPQQFSWQRNWCGPEELADQMLSATICFGVFGGKGKAARVFPFKAYHALAMGQIVVTQDGYALPRGLPQPPCEFVAPDPESLAERLRLLLSAPGPLEVMRDRAALYHHEWLGDAAIAARWRELGSRC